MKTLSERDYDGGIPGERILDRTKSEESDPCTKAHDDASKRTMTVWSASGIPALKSTRTNYPKAVEGDLELVETKEAETDVSASRSGNRAFSRSTR